MAGLYLHIPFCRRKCPYCDFYSVHASEPLLESYPDLLIRHLAWASEHGWSGPFDSVYFGGGTPSLMPPKAISDILHTVNQRFGLMHNAEITLEANPGTVTQDNLIGYRNSGINRLSLGLQTCHDKQLVNLGRLHDRQEGLDAFDLARVAGFDNISLDLMFALPGQTKEELESDLNDYLELDPEHLSCYGLTAEFETPFYKQVISGEMSLPDADFYADAFMRVHDKLSQNGYDHYEIANYAKKDKTCRHNLGYWKRRPYLGIGAGAHSFCAKGWGQRREVPSDLVAYREALCNDQDPTQHLESFDKESALHETVYLALRTRYGVADSELRQRFGCTLLEAFPEAITAIDQWLVHSNDRWALTPAGWLLFDRLILPFL